MRWRWIAVSAIIGSIALITITVLVVRARRWNSTLMTLQGAVIRRDSDTEKEVPISDAQITATRGAMTISTRSDASGYFKIKFPEVIWPGQTVVLAFRHEDYKPLDIDLHIQFRSMMRRLYIAAMEPVPSAPQTKTLPGKPTTVVSNIRVRYTENFQTDEDVGSAVRTFQVVSHGNIPCRREAPCSRMEAGKQPRLRSHWTPGWATSSAMSELPASPVPAPLRGSIRADFRSRVELSRFRPSIGRIRRHFYWKLRSYAR